jgi:hypothetical protein
MNCIKEWASVSYLRQGGKQNGSYVVFWNHIHKGEKACHVEKKFHGIPCGIHLPRCRNLQTIHP